jgi:hypothetical protein
MGLKGLPSTSLAPTPSAFGRGFFFGQERCLLVVSKRRRLSIARLQQASRPRPLSLMPQLAPEAGAAREKAQSKRGRLGGQPQHN